MKLSKVKRKKFNSKAFIAAAKKARKVLDKEDEYLLKQKLKRLILEK